MIRIPHFKMKIRPHQGLWTSLRLVFCTEQMPMLVTRHPGYRGAGLRCRIALCLQASWRLAMVSSYNPLTTLQQTSTGITRIRPDVHPRAGKVRPQGMCICMLQRHHSLANHRRCPGPYPKGGNPDVPVLANPRNSCGCASAPPAF